MLHGFDLQTQAHMLGMAAPGELVRFLSENGYPHELAAALEEFGDSEELIVADLHIGNWQSSYRFEGVNGRWNTVMFEPASAIETESGDVEQAPSRSDESAAREAGDAR